MEEGRGLKDKEYSPEKGERSNNRTRQYLYRVDFK
jgi:hypothetical protein